MTCVSELYRTGQVETGLRTGLAVLGVLRGLWPALVAGAASFLLVDYFFVPPIASPSIADEQDVVWTERGRVSPAVGTGLGLAIVKGWWRRTPARAVENADRRGTSFRFTLPLADGRGHPRKIVERLLRGRSLLFQHAS